MKVLRFLTFLKIVNSIYYCSWTNTPYLCKETNGYGPLTYKCSSECTSGQGSSFTCDQTSFSCLGPVDCTGTLQQVSIGNRYDRDEPYNSDITFFENINDASNGDNGNRTDWITNSDDEYCPEKTC